MSNASLVCSLSARCRTSHAVRILRRSGISSVAARRSPLALLTPCRAAANLPSPQHMFVRPFQNVVPDARAHSSLQNSKFVLPTRAKHLSDRVRVATETRMNSTIHRAAPHIDLDNKMSGNSCFECSCISFRQHGNASDPS